MSTTPVVTGRSEKRSATTLAVGVVLAAAFYRSLNMWAANAWDLSSPVKILLIGSALGVVASGMLLVLSRLGLQSLPTALCIGGLLLVLMNWQTLDPWMRPTLIGLILLFGWLSHEGDSLPHWSWLAIVFVASFGLAPVLQLVLAHIQDPGPYPLIDLAGPEPATASGSIEDIVFLVVDSYPNLQIGGSWFGHDPGPLVDDLEDLGFVVEPGAWSQHTFTVLSVSSVLELQSVIEAGPTRRWGNRSSVFNILRGDNLVSQSLESAGFRYTHFESGWDGTSCGPLVDRCVESPWLDEQVWELTVPTFAEDWMSDRYFTVTGTLNVAQSLETELETVVSNSSHDFVFAHFLLPHDPILVDENCQLLDTTVEDTAEVSTVRAAFSDQMSCVDRLLPQALNAVDGDTAVLAAGDHGPSTSHQLGLDPGQWSDADIAERFSVLLAYKMPTECETPSLPDPIVTMAAIISCALEQTHDSGPPRYLVGADDPELVDPDRMARIQDLVASGSLPPDPR